ncbi:MAG: DUF808 family protein, partial [Pedobacter sp.]
HEVVAEIKQDDIEIEKTKIKSAVTTDFILSVEIVIIALGTVLTESLTLRILTVSVVALIATIGVYGIVAVIVRLDDFGYQIIKRAGDKGVFATVGNILVKSLPIIIRILSVVGTIALILVSGGIFAHNIDFLHHLRPGIPAMLKEFLIGIVAGLIVLGIVTVGKSLYAKLRAN